LKTAINSLQDMALPYAIGGSLKNQARNDRLVYNRRGKAACTAAAPSPLRGRRSARVPVRQYHGEHLVVWGRHWHLLEAV